MHNFRFATNSIVKEALIIFRQSRVKYQYQRIAFGQVKGFHDLTEEECGRVIRPDNNPILPDTPEVDPISETTNTPSGSSGPLWLENAGGQPSVGTQIVRELDAGEILYITGGQFLVGDVFCGEDETQICILVYEATSPQTVTLDHVIERNNFVARTKSLSYDDLINIHTDYYWQTPNCTDGCAKATIHHIKDGRLVTGPVTMLRP